MKDISTRADIEFLVKRFYSTVIKDDLIGNFFTEVVQLDFEKHLPIMYDFWESIIFEKAIYRGNPMGVHIQLNKLKTINPEHFERWLTLWEKNINENFEGTNTAKAIDRASQIAGLMEFKIAQERSK